MTDALVKWQKYEPFIYFLVIADEEYLVYLDSENTVHWDYDPPVTKDEDEEVTDSDDQYDPGELERIFNRAAMLETTPCSDLPFDMQRAFKRLIGEGVARAFEDQYKFSDEILDVAAGYIGARNQEAQRSWYLTASSMMTAFFMIVGLFDWLFRTGAIAALGEPVFWLILSASAGAMGAWLSVIERAGKLRFEAGSAKSVYYQEAASRIAAGAISGFFVSGAVMSGLLLSTLTRGSNLIAFELLGAFAAGTSERLATSIITKLGANELKKSSQQNY